MSLHQTPCPCCGAGVQPGVGNACSDLGVHPGGIFWASFQSEEAPCVCSLLPILPAQSTGKYLGRKPALPCELHFVVKPARPDAHLGRGQLLSQASSDRRCSPAGLGQCAMAGHHPQLQAAEVMQAGHRELDLSFLQRSVHYYHRAAPHRGTDAAALNELFSHVNSRS